MLCLGLVHGQRRGKNARMGIGNFEIFEDSLNRSVFAEWSVKRVEDHIRAQFLKHRRDVVTDIDARDAIAFAFQSIRASRPPKTGSPASPRKIRPTGQRHACCSFKPPNNTPLSRSLLAPG